MQGISLTCQRAVFIIIIIIIIIIILIIIITAIIIIIILGQAAQLPPKKRTCLSQAPTKRGVRASFPAAILLTDPADLDAQVAR
jgi:hypothetical protein